MSASVFWSSAWLNSTMEPRPNRVETIVSCLRNSGRVAKLERLAAQKRRKVGGFGKGLMLVQTEEVPLLEIRSGNGLFNTQAIRASRDSYQAIVAAGRRLKTRRDRIII